MIVRGVAGLTPDEVQEARSRLVDALRRVVEGVGTSRWWIEADGPGDPL